MIELLIGIFIGFFVGVGVTAFILYLILRHPSFLLSQILKSPVVFKELLETLPTIPESEKKPEPEEKPKEEVK